MEENVVIDSGIFVYGTPEEQIEYIKSLYPNKKFDIHMIVSGTAHITVYH